MKTLGMAEKADGNLIIFALLKRAKDSRPKTKKPAPVTRASRFQAENHFGETTR
jgi:hypothetical protein